MCKMKSAIEIKLSLLSLLLSLMLVLLLKKFVLLVCLFVFKPLWHSWDLYKLKQDTENKQIMAIQR